MKKKKNIKFDLGQWVIVYRPNNHTLRRLSKPLVSLYTTGQGKSLTGYRRTTSSYYLFYRKNRVPLLKLQQLFEFYRQENIRPPMSIQEAIIRADNIVLRNNSDVSIHGYYKSGWIDDNKD